MVPKKMFFTKGVGVHTDYLQSYELALRNAKIEKCNLVHVSSIVPPQCKIISKKQGSSLIQPGQITHCVMAKNSTNEPNRLVTASIGLAIPKEKECYGYLSEHHGFGETAKKAGDYAEDLAATMLATTLGVDFDPEKAWDERKNEYKLSGRFVRSLNITQSARGDLEGLWTTVIAAAVLLLE
jgi:arginine decarboxylase